MRRTRAEPLRFHHRKLAIAPEVYERLRSFQRELSVKLAGERPTLDQSVEIALRLAMEGLMLWPGRSGELLKETWEEFQAVGDAE